MLLGIVGDCYNMAIRNLLLQIATPLRLFLIYSLYESIHPAYRS